MNILNLFHKVIKYVDYIKQFILNIITTKGYNNIMFIPHQNCKTDEYDILNPLSDNVLCLFDSILKDRRFNEYRLFLGYYHQEKIELYKDYCGLFDPKRVIFFYIDDKKDFFRAFRHAHIIFTDEIYHSYPYKTKKQKIICLNYYAGFMKNDFYRIANHGGLRKMIKDLKHIAKNYDSILTTSDISSMFTAVEDSVYFGSLLPLGFPRNDIFFQNNFALREEIKKNLNVDVDNIFTYVPTHRDYENEKREFFDPDSIMPRSIFGPISKEDAIKIDRILEKTNSILIAKVHPAQVTSNIKEYNFKRVVFFHELVKKTVVSLNQILAISDCLISDYTTAVYDFMYLNRPIIYFFYDYDKYVGSRGLFIDPIEPICMGEIVNDVSGLCNAIMDVVNGVDRYKNKREILSHLFVKYLDGKSVERIKNYFFKET